MAEKSSILARAAEFLATPTGKRLRQAFFWVVWPTVVAALGLPVEADVKTRELLDLPAACEVCPVCPEAAPAEVPEPDNTAGADHDAGVPPPVDEALLHVVAE